jgi:hypothetical protein
VKLVLIRALTIELFLLLKCRQIWIFRNIFLNSFLHQISAQHINPEITYIGGRSRRTNNKNSINISVPYTVQFIGLFGFIWLLYKFVSSAILASSSSVKKNVLEKLMGSTELQNFFWQFHIFLESEDSFQRLCPPNYTLSAFSRSFVCIIWCHWYAWNCRISGITDVFHIIWKVVIIYR